MANKAVIAVVAIAGIGIVAYLLWKYLKNYYSPQAALQSLQNALSPYLSNTQAMNQFQEEAVGGNPLQTIERTLGNLIVTETTNTEGNYVNEWYVVPNTYIGHIVSSSGGGSVHYWTPQGSYFQLFQNNPTQGKIIRPL
jgi:hypothetical protein